MNNLFPSSHDSEWGKILNNYHGTCPIYLTKAFIHNHQVSATSTKKDDVLWYRVFDQQHVARNHWMTCDWRDLSVGSNFYWPENIFYLELCKRFLFNLLNKNFDLFRRRIQVAHVSNFATKESLFNLKLVYFKKILNLNILNLKFK